MARPRKIFDDENLEEQAPEEQVDAPKQYRVLETTRFLLNGAFYSIPKGQIISALTHDVDAMLPQVPTEEA